MPARKKIGVVLFQLGGPDTPQAVEPFLYNLFCDPEIIPLGVFGSLLRKPLAKYISTRRAKIVAQHYAEIGGQSPIRLLTERQAQKLAAALAPQVDACVTIAMRYWNPLTQAAVSEINRFGPEELVLLPLYPQYSYATTRSSLKEWSRLYKLPHPPLPLHVIESFYNHPQYIEALVERIRTTLTHFDEPERAHIVFSAHGLPLSLVEQGDPYQRQVEATVRLVLERGAWRNTHTLCYQSKVGRQKWLEPSLTTTIENLARASEKRLLIVPIAFVTEHIETLHEINIEAREEAEHLGVEQFEMMPAVGDSPLFISALADLVLRAVGLEVSFTSRTT